MPEVVETSNISEIGRGQFERLVGVLTRREAEQNNVILWGGTAQELGPLLPAAAFAVVAEGTTRYKKTSPDFTEHTESARELATLLSEGAQVYGQAREVDEATLKNQIRSFVESHGGTFDPDTDWQKLIQERSDKIFQKANAIDSLMNSRSESIM